MWLKDTLKERLIGIVRQSIDGDEFVIREGNNQLTGPATIRGQLRLGRYSTIGPYGQFVGDISIGRYCQLASHCAIYAVDHPVHLISTYMNRRLFDGRLKEHAIARPVVVGHDVWLGHGAVILKGVKVGSGAVVGAGSVVTKDVPPFAIVAGNPARQLRRRFSDDVCTAIANSLWWERDADQLLTQESAFHADLRAQSPKALELLRDLEDFLCTKKDEAPSSPVSPES